MQLLIEYSGGGYTLVYPNTNEVIGFILNAENEASSVQLLATEMQQGFSAVVENAQFIFENGADIQPEVLSAFFTNANELVFVGNVVYEAGEGMTLMDGIAEAGELLAALLP